MVGSTDTCYNTVSKIENGKRCSGLSCYNPTTVHCVVT